MAFKARKTRERKQEPLIKGKPLIPSAAIEQWYSRELRGFIQAMAADYRAEIEDLMSLKGTKQYYTADAKLPTGRFKSMFEKTFKKWTSRMFKFADRVTKEASIKVDKHSFTSVGSSLKALGIKEPKEAKKLDWETQMQLYIQQNTSLIKSITQEFHDKIENATWNSLTSPRGSEQGAHGISKYITETAGASKARANLIAMDQTKKLFCVLNNARMEQNGVTKFIWLHSSAGKTPRHSHVELDGQTFSTFGPPSELYRIDGSRVKLAKNDDGKPGHAINCRCRAIPVIELD